MNMAETTMTTRSPTIRPSRRVLECGEPIAQTHGNSGGDVT